MYYAIKRWFKWELPYYPKYFVEGVKNLIRWFPIVWKDRDWDTHYIWEVMKFKLKNQAKYIGEHDRHMSAKRDAEIMKLCVKLMDRIQNEYYSAEYMNYHKSKYYFIDTEDENLKELKHHLLTENYDNFFAKYPLVYKKVMQTEQLPFRKDTKEGIAINISRLNHIRARKLLFQILENNIEGWWD
jgi:hypothetical protein